MPKSFKAAIGRRPKILILGSMPGAASLRLRQYYGHPQNNFWRLVGEVLGEDLAGLSYPKRLSLLKKRRIALWDVIRRCTRRGSLDSNIRDEQTNRIMPLLRKERGIEAVFFNGNKAYTAFFRRHGKEISTLRALKWHALPSSSPAHASVSYKAKLRRWRRIADYLIVNS